MIKPEVKWIDWTDEFTGTETEPDFLLVTAGIGEHGSEGADNFSVNVCNVAGLNTMLRGKSGLWPRGMLIVAKIELGHIEKALQNLANQFSGSRNCTIFTERLNRYLHWEFEDMDDYQGEPEIPHFD